MFNIGTVQGSDVSITGTTLASLQTQDLSLYATCVSQYRAIKVFCGSGFVTLLIETQAQQEALTNGPSPSVYTAPNHF